jgi:hypothetical protein
MKTFTFNNLPLGIYSLDTLKQQWGDAVGVKGINEGRCSIVDIDGEHVLEVLYPTGKFGNNEGGAKWNYIFDRPYEEYTVEYKIRIPKDFDFVRGGKLPGLYGGSGPAGGASVKEADGFSARIMWRELGVLCQYVYYVDKGNGRWGQDFLWTNGSDKNMPITKEMWKDMNTRLDDRIYLVSDTWHTLKTYVKMNTPRQEDGKIISWFDGQEVVNLNLRFREDLSFGIDQFKFTTFFGGNDETWAPKKDEKMYFKDFKFIPPTVQ